MSENLSGFLLSLGARHTKNGEFVFPVCWECQGHETLYFNVNKMIGICHKCPRTVTIQNIATQLAGIPLGKIKEYVEDHRVEERRKYGFKDAMLEGLLGVGSVRELPALSPIELPPEFRLLEEAQQSVVGKKAIEYMISRNFTRSVLFEMGFGYCDSGQFEGRVIIPFHEDGELVYWQARDFTGKQPPESKVLNPPTWFSSHGKSDVLFNYDKAREYDVNIVCESWGSALAVGRQTVAINGKSMSEVQLQKIVRMKAHTIVVLLDAGTQVESWKVAERIHQAGKHTVVCNLPFDDPNDAPTRVLLDTIRCGKTYTKEEHIRCVATGTWS